MKHYFFILIIFLKEHIKEPNMITQLGLLLVFFFLNIFFWKYKNFYTQNLMSFHAFKLNHKIEAFLILTCYFCFYILGFLYLRFGYFGHSIDLALVINYMKLFFIIKNNLAILISLLFFINLFILLLLIFNLLKTIIYKHFLQLHFYIISKYPMDLTTNLYNNIRRNIFYKLMSKIKNIPVQYIRKLKKILGITVDESNLTQYEFLFLNLQKFYALFILLLLVLYDIIFNNFILTKFYYFLPIAFLYTLLVYVDQFYTFTKMEEYDIACYFYIEKVLETEDEVFYANGHSLNKKDFNEDLQRHFPGVHITEF
jgi:hypothetical protein